ncbi:hypothetical protein STEG23_007223, partial [Scotinomys teguina]
MAKEISSKPGYTMTTLQKYQPSLEISSTVVNDGNQLGFFSLQNGETADVVRST